MLNIKIDENGNIYNKKGVQLKTRIRNGKYEISLNGKVYMVARLIYNYFNPNWSLESKLVIGYKDGNPLNIHKDNLFVQRRADAYKNKLTKEEQDAIIKSRKSSRKLAKEYGCSAPVICKIRKRAREC